MNVGEGTGVGTNAAMKDAPDSVCNIQDEPVENKNDLVADFDEDEEEAKGEGSDSEAAAIEVKFNNCSKKLGRVIGDAPTEKISVIKTHSSTSDGAKRRKTGGPSEYELGYAAHHLIPGIGSLKKSDLFKFLHTDGMAEGNIGYNINSKENGVWLPSYQGVTGFGGMGSFKTSYANAAMEKTKSQFHTGHQLYSKNVLAILNKIAQKLVAQKDNGCPDKKEETHSDLSFLVGRLNTESSLLRGYITGPPSSWNKTFHTSTYAKKLKKSLNESGSEP